MATPLERAVSVVLGQPAGQWVRERRESGTSWRMISLELRDKTDGQLDVAPSTLRDWAEVDEDQDQADEPARAS